MFAVQNLAIMIVFATIVSILIILFFLFIFNQINNKKKNHFDEKFLMSQSEVSDEIIAVISASINSVYGENKYKIIKIEPVGNSQNA